MTIRLNGEPFEIAGPVSISALLATLNIDSRIVAVEHNVVFVPGSAFFVEGRGSKFARLSFSWPTPERIEIGVRRLAETVRDARGLTDSTTDRARAAASSAPQPDSAAARRER